MKLFSSLRNRIFLTSALLAVLSIGVAVYLVSVRVSVELEQQLQREIVSAGGLVDQLRSTRGQVFTTMARLIADAPKLKAAVDTNDPPTVQDTLSSYQNQLNASLLLVTNRTGRVLATVTASQRTAGIVAGQPSIREAIAGHESFTLLPEQEGLLQLVTVPIAVGLVHPDVLGTLSVGFLFDDSLAAQLKGATGTEIAFAMDGQVLATTLPAEDRSAVAGLRYSPGQAGEVTLPTGEYIVLPLALSVDGGGRSASDGGPVALILRSRTAQRRFLRTIHTELAVTAVVAVLLATLLSFAVARTITKPLAAITDVMRDVAATGDLTRKIAQGGQRWDDEDARLLATTFNTLTDSIARFQREMSQKERLSSLGRLSTVIAHEIRNPLMIIKAALHTLRRTDVPQTALHEAVTDIDEEVARLNRIVNEVLDFARPISFELAQTDINAVCAESAAAAQTVPGAPVQVTFDRTLPKVMTDAERLRIALVNLIVNARQAIAVPESTAAGSGGHYAPGQANGEEAPRVAVSTCRLSDRLAITIEDSGHGIDERVLPHVFDPFFTTKRGGTGLGLPIAKNIIDGLGGTIAIASVGGGTQVRIEFPLDAHARVA